MKRIVALTAFFLACGVVAAQDNGGGQVDVISELWLFEDARPVLEDQVDLRLTFGWESASAPANGGDSDDDFFLRPSVVFGIDENVEVSLGVPVWLGDSGDVGALEDGNGDSFIGLLWRLCDQEGDTPAVALSGTVRLPTGDDSNGLDAELRLVLTNEYDGGLRSHVNVFAKSVNTDNEGNARHFQWGFVAGMDGPLCKDGEVRWVADYMLRSSERFGSADINILELGWEWRLAEAEAIGMSVQIGLDDHDDTPNFGAGLAYSYTIRN